MPIALTTWPRTCASPRRFDVPDPAELFAALSRAFRALDAGWYVFGAQEVLIWGRPRLTADVDVTIRLEPEEPERLVTAVQKVLAGRPKDLDDVRGVLIARWERLDFASIRATLTLLEGALAMSDLTPAFETALVDASRVRQRM